MATEAGELSGGWPLGLENMNIRLEIVDNFQISREPYTSQPRSTSFSSYTSSELDTESTRSSFQDPSVSLGRLLGMKPRQGEDFYFRDLTRLEETHGVLSTATKRHEIDTSHGICIPLFLNFRFKISPDKSCGRGQ
ncbi:hypothetical protein MKX03_013910 [Papaver bracteatum]|nr:hypothetical protein MKX03_013910 [Papaver bracteatum]